MLPSLRRSMKLKRWQNAFDFLPVRFKPRWKLEVLTELVRRFVNSKTRGIRRQLEQHAAGLPEINGMKIAAVDDRSYIDVLFEQFLTPRSLRLVVSHPPGDVVHSAH